MKVFISSLIRGQELLREAAARAIDALGHDVVRSEDFEASSDSPQAACLASVRESDAVVLILGEEYGRSQASGFSATHEEYREARESVPILAFVEDGVEPRVEQQAFIREVQDWERGCFTASFRGAEDLHAKVVRGLHDLVRSGASSAPDEGVLARQSLALVPDLSLGLGTLLVVAAASGPMRAVLRPTEVEDENLNRFLLDEALAGVNSVLEPTADTTTSIEGDALVVRQGNGAFLSLNEGGGMVVAQQAIESRSLRSGIPSLIEETVRERISHALRFIGAVLEHVDEPCRLSHVAVTAGLLRASHLGWKTQEEHARNPHIATICVDMPDRILVQLSPPVRKRAALKHETRTLAEDLTVRLRREVRRSSRFGYDARFDSDRPY